MWMIESSGQRLYAYLRRTIDIKEHLNKRRELRDGRVCWLLIEENKFLIWVFEVYSQYLLKTLKLCSCLPHVLLLLWYNRSICRLFTTPELQANKVTLWVVHVGRISSIYKMTFAPHIWAKLTFWENKWKQITKQ